MQATPSRSAVLLMTLSLAPLAVAASEAPQTGQWQPHELEFTYVGFTSHYSCDGLADKLALLLKVAGARADAKAVGGGCDHVLGGPSRVAHARLNFHTLAPAAPAETPKLPPPAGRELGKPAPALKPAATAPEPGVGA